MRPRGAVPMGHHDLQERGRTVRPPNWTDRPCRGRGDHPSPRGAGSPLSHNHRKRLEAPSDAVPPTGHLAHQCAGRRGIFHAVQQSLGPRLVALIRIPCAYFTGASCERRHGHLPRPCTSDGCHAGSDFSRVQPLAKAALILAGDVAGRFGKLARGHGHRSVWAISTPNARQWRLGSAFPERLCPLPMLTRCCQYRREIDRITLTSGYCCHAEVGVPKGTPLPLPHLRCRPAVRPGRRPADLRSLRGDRAH